MVQLSEVTGPEFLEGLSGWPMNEVRSRRDELNELETGLSFLRRMVQGRLDIVLAEQDRRRAGGGQDAPNLVEQLPSILSEKVHAPGLGRLPSLMAPGEVDPDLARRLEEVLPADHLARIGDEPDAGLTQSAAALAELERVVSASRRSVQDVLDRLQAEIVRRYQSGEATVDQLLP